MFLLVSSFLLCSFSSCQLHGRRYVNSTTISPTSSSTAGNDCVITSLVTSFLASTETSTTTVAEATPTLAPFVSIVTVTGPGVYVTLNSTSTSTVVYTEAAGQSSVTTTPGAIPDTATATAASPATSALSSTSAVVTARAANAARDTSTSQDVCPSTCSSCGVVFSTVTATATESALFTVHLTLTATNTIAPSPTRSTLFSTVTVQPFTLTSIQAVIQVTTTTVKASQPSHPAATTAPANTLIVAPLITLGGTTYTPNPSSVYIIGGSTLTPGGPPITVSGAVYSLSPGATKLVVGANGAASVHVTPTTVLLAITTITESLAPTTTSGLGPVICAGLRGCQGPTPTTGGQATFTGGAAIWRKASSNRKIMCAMCIAVPGLLF